MAHQRSEPLVPTTHADGSTESFAYFPDDTLATWTTRVANTAGEQLVLAHTYDAANRLTFRGPANPLSFDDATRPAGLAPLDGAS